ncbi:MAG: radical SAM protein [Betaproteobacteria bacterium]|nr:radical SAM protein [Betaproteobacteria bacterium]MDH3438591.1 radical SAM protein [Betaproteobacteria bacterium]
MNLTKQAAVFLEGRIAAPGWRHFMYFVNMSLRRDVRRRRPKSEDADLRDKFCSNPFELFEMHEDGSVFMCCPRWLPWTAGNLHGQDADAIWNSPRAQEVRRSILDGDFKYCNRDLCPLIASDSLPSRAQARKNPFLRDIIDNRKTVLDPLPRRINLSNDRSCNLSCPSCRTRVLNFATGYAYELRKKLQDRLVKAFFSKPTKAVFAVNVTGSGDPFASRVLREFLHQLDSKDFPNLHVYLQTNGTLFNEKAWRRLSKIRNNISTVSVSFDAAREETYKITRRGGNWQHLLNNMRFLSQLRANGSLRHLRIDYVVQGANFREMPEFVAIGKELSVDVVAFSKAVNWGTWTAGEYRDLSVWDATHPDHAEFQRIIAQPVFDDAKVSLGNLTQDRRQALRAHTPVEAAESHLTVSS